MRGKNGKKGKGKGKDVLDTRKTFKPNLDADGNCLFKGIAYDPKFENKSFYAARLAVLALGKKFTFLLRRDNSVRG